MFPNIATVIAFAAVAVIFGIFGAATVREHPGPVPASIWVATGIAVALSIYALVASRWPWIAGSLGVFCFVHLFVGVKQSRGGKDSSPADA